MYGIDFHFYKIRYTNTKGDWYNGFFWRWHLLVTSGYLIVLSYEKGNDWLIFFIKIS